MIITVELLLMLLMLLLIGGFAGVIAGLLGVGGGIILVPAFFFAFEFLGYGSVYLMQICLATSLATIVITSIRSVQLHNSKGAVNWQILREWFIGIGFGAIIGVFLASSLSSTILMIIFGSPPKTKGYLDTITTIRLMLKMTMKCYIFLLG